MAGFSYVFFIGLASPPKVIQRWSSQDRETGWPSFPIFSTLGKDQPSPRLPAQGAGPTTPRAAESGSQGRTAAVCVVHLGTGDSSCLDHLGVLDDRLLIRLLHALPPMKSPAGLNWFLPVVGSE